MHTGVVGGMCTAEWLGVTLSSDNDVGQNL